MASRRGGAQRSIKGPHILGQARRAVGRQALALCGADEHLHHIRLHRMQLK